MLDEIFDEQTIKPIDNEKLNQLKISFSDKTLK